MKINVIDPFIVLLETVFYAFIGLIGYLHDGDKGRAEESFQKFRSRENVRTLPPNEEQADGWNQDLYDAIRFYCCQDNMTAPYLAEAIDAFLTPTEKYNEE